MNHDSSFPFVFEDPSTQHNKQFDLQGTKPPNKYVHELVDTNSTAIAGTSIDYSHGIRKVPQPPAAVQEIHRNYLFVPVENNEHNHHNDTTPDGTASTNCNKTNAIVWRIPAKYHRYCRSHFPTNTTTTAVTPSPAQQGDQESFDELSIPMLPDLGSLKSFRNHRSRPSCNIIPLRMKPFHFPVNLIQKEESFFRASPEEEGSAQHASHAEEKKTDYCNHDMRHSHYNDVGTNYDVTTPIKLLPCTEANPSTPIMGGHDDVILQGATPMASQENNNGYQTPSQGTG